MESLTSTIPRLSRSATASTSLSAPAPGGLYPKTVGRGAATCDNNDVFVGSANLTGQALATNVELVVRVDDLTAPALVDEFLNMWQSLHGQSKSPRELRLLAENLRNHPVRRRFDQVRTGNGLVDYGGSTLPPSQTTSHERFWLKLNGTATDRANMNRDLRESYEYEGAQTFPGPHHRPTGVREGDLMVLSWIGNRDGKPDRCIYGRSIVDLAHRPGIEEAPSWLRHAIGSRHYEDLQIERWPKIV